MRLATLAAAALWLPACSVALPSLWERTNTTPPATAQMSQPAEPVTTGSIRRPAPDAAAATPGAPPIPEADWEMARRRLMEALADPAETPSLRWENAESGMHGTVTALQRATGAGGEVCRDFLGSAIKERAEHWFDGRACRRGGAWTVVEMRPWRRG